VLIEAEDVAAVETDALKNTVAIKQTVVEHGHFGIGAVDKLAIEINLHRSRA
jgi:hypothetical protein